MIDLMNINYAPNIDEVSQYIENPLFDHFYQYMLEEYRAICKIEYSKDTWAPGWNIKLRKSGKSLCVIYPRKYYFTVLVVIGQKEKESAENLLPHMSQEIQNIYRATKYGNGQRWLMIDLKNNDRLFQDTLALIRIRRESK